jgi:hypothetical protein
MGAGVGTGVDTGRDQRPLAQSDAEGRIGKRAISGFERRQIVRE